MTEELLDKAEIYLKGWYSHHPELTEQSDREMMAHLDELIAWTAQRDGPLVRDLSKEDWRYVMEDFLSKRSDYEIYLTTRVYKSVDAWVSRNPHLKHISDLRTNCASYLLFLETTDSELHTRVREFDADLNPISYILKYYNHPNELSIDFSDILSQVENPVTPYY